MIRGIGFPQPPEDGITEEDGEANGGVNIFPRPTRVPLTLSRPSGNGNETPSNSGWTPKNYSGSGSFHKDRAGSFARQHSSVQDDSFFPSDEKEDGCFPNSKTEKLQYARAENRTLIIKNLSDRATHKDIVDIIRGGAVLDIFLRANERSASVSFVEGSAAQDFLSYTKRNDIYIHGKRVILLYQTRKEETDFFLLQLEFSWNDRQFILPGHVANKIGIGATRNLAIRGVHPNITEERLRDDLDHIHNLVVINITFQNGDALLSLNSVHNSLFARTCMMSRAVYKGMRIEWYPDECAQPLPKIQYTPKKETVQPAPKKSQPVNRFDVLNMDGTEDGDEDGSDEEESAEATSLEDFSAPINHRSPWNARVVAV